MTRFTGFADRREAGRLLAERLQGYRGRDVVVLALPRGGVPVGYEVARALGAPLDVIVARKLGAPYQPEFGIGAIAEGGGRYVDPVSLRYAGGDDAYLEQVTAREERELARRVERYRGDRPRPDVVGRVVILVDDGVATGGTVRAAIRSLRAQGPDHLVLAVPVGPASTLEILRGEVDELVAVAEPSAFMAISQWYDRFPQTEDEEVIALLEATRGDGQAPEPSPRRPPGAGGEWVV